MVNMWFPMHDVAVKDSCLAFAPKQHRSGLYDNDESEAQNGFIGISPEQAEKLPCYPVELNARDVVLFTNTTPHTALSNDSGLMRWSWDVRFIDLADADGKTMELGSIARHQDANQICDSETFIEKWKTAAW